MRDSLQQTLDNLFVRYTRWVLRWRWAVLFATAALGLACAAGMVFFQFDSEYEVFFNEDDPKLQKYAALQRTFTKDDTVFFIVTAKEGEVFERDVLQAIDYLTQEAWKLPHAIRADSIANFQHTWAEGDDLKVAPLIDDPAAMTEAEIEKARRIAFDQPELAGRLVKEGSPVTGVNVTVYLPEGTSGMDTVDAARELVAEVEEQYPSVELGLTGILPINNAFFEATKHDLQTLIPIMVVLIAITMAVLLHSFWLTVGTLIVVAMASASAVGIISYLGYAMSGPVAPAPMLILTLAVADCIHILIGFQWHLRSGYEKEDALVESMRMNTMPVFLTSLTTAIGFLCMNTNPVPPQVLMGNTTAIGIFFAFFFSITFLPAFIGVLTADERKHAGHAGPQRFMEQLGEWVLRYRKRLLVALPAVTLALAVFIPTIPINNQFVEWFDPHVPIRRDTEYLNKHLSGFNRLMFRMDAAESGGINEPSYLQNLEKFSQWLEAQPEIEHVDSMARIMKRLNKSMHGDDPAMYTLPDRRDLAAQYLLLYELSLPQGLDLTAMINVDRSATRLIATTTDLRSEATLKLVDRIQQWEKENLPGHMYSDALGPSVLFANISRTMMRSMAISGPVALTLVSIALIIALGSLKFGLLSIIPNVMPLAVGFGIWGIFGWDMNFSLSSIIAMSIGIVVDDTVHLLSKYLRARRFRGESPEDSVRFAFASVGKAVWVTSFILVAGFSILTLSYMQYSESVGILTSIVIAAALIIDLLLLPPLLLLVDRRRKQAGPASAAAVSAAVQEEPSSTSA